MSHFLRLALALGLVAGIGLIWFCRELGKYPIFDNKSPSFDD